MKKQNIHALLAIAALMVISLAAFGYATSSPAGPETDPAAPDGSPFLSMSAQMDRGKVAVGSDGRVSMALTLTAPALDGEAVSAAPATAMVVVLDRSGSMRGQKLNYAKSAVLDLLSRLSPKDRFSLVAYSDRVTRYCDLEPVTPELRHRVSQAVMAIPASGNTNLSGGLEAGIHLLGQSDLLDMPRRLLLISDGLANRGVTHPDDLGKMAADGAARGVGISTIGVGLEFNEALMARIADFGAGRYHYLAEAGAFAAIFADEFHKTRTVAASGVRVNIPLKNGVSLLEASGYPVQVKNGVASFSPGDLVSGQSRRLFLTFVVPTRQARTFEMEGLEVTWRKSGGVVRQKLDRHFYVACVPDEKEARASLTPKVWEEKVVQDEYNKLKDEVSTDIRSGKKESALSRIQNYLFRYRRANETVGSAKVADNLDHDVKDLEQTVENAFSGPAPQSAVERKKSAKALQFEAYSGRRQTK